jgi:microprocessor complex subunit DGCR8
MADDEVDALLEENVAKPADCEAAVEHTEKVKHKMIEKGKNHFDVLPQGWIKVDHMSGMPVYLHRPTRAVSLSRPYHLGTASARVSIITLQSEFSKASSSKVSSSKASSLKK